VEQSIHTMRLQPVQDELQALLDFQLEIVPPLRFGNDKVDYEDVFGNIVSFFQSEQHYTELRLLSRSTVKVIVPPTVDLTAGIRRSTIPLMWMPWQRQMMLSYLLPPELPESQLRELSDFAMSFVERNDYDLFETLKDMNLTLHQDWAYVPGSTTLKSTPFEVFITRQGVCQDFANLLICMARLLNIPARYRVGYIDTHADYTNTIQSEASHAWVEVYLPYVGWRGLDPTNGCLVTLDHVRVACGRNYRDASPTSGTIYKGGGKETLTARVQVIPVK
jgi:transglutaminase-like putative cysteine protease